MEQVDDRAIPKRWLNVAETAEYLGMTERWLRRQIMERRITYFKIGGRVLFDQHDLDQYVKAGKRNANHPLRRQPSRTA